MNLDGVHVCTIIITTNNDYGIEKPYKTINSIVQQPKLQFTVLPKNLIN